MKCEEINKRIFDIAKAQGLKKIPLATIAGVSYNTIDYQKYLALKSLWLMPQKFAMYLTLP